MQPFKGGVKYIALLMAAGWIFFLGVLAGRGTSPVTFDTQNFQDRLADIAKKYQSDSPEPKKVELDFYKALNEPVSIEGIIKDDRPRKIDTGKTIQNPVAAVDPGIVPKKEEAVTVTKDETTGKEAINRDVPVKISLKQMTVTKSMPEKATPVVLASEPIEKKSVVVEIKTQPSPPVPASEPEPESKPYTIQVASYPNFQDALTHIQALEKKGVAAYRALGKNNDQIWYRVRTGSFASMEEAGKYLETLKAEGIKGIIIKRTDDENIR